MVVAITLYSSSDRVIKIWNIFKKVLDTEARAQMNHGTLLFTLCVCFGIILQN